MLASCQVFFWFGMWKSRYESLYLAMLDVYLAEKDNNNMENLTKTKKGNKVAPTPKCT